MRRFLAALCVCVIGLSAARCSDNSPSTPTPPGITLTGVWVGSLDVLGLSARMTWTLQQASSSVTGPALIGLSNGTILLNGFLTGTLSGSTLTYTISVAPGGIPTQPSCSGAFGGTMTANIGVTATLTGTSSVKSSTCSTPPFAGGSLTLTRQ